MITQNQINYLVDLFKKTNKQNDTISLKEKKDKYYVYAFQSYSLDDNNQIETYKEILNVFNFHDPDDHDIKYSFQYNNFNFIIKIFHLNDKHWGEQISIRYFIYSNNFKNFAHEFNMAFSQIEASFNKKLEKQKKRIEKANKKINALENLIGAPLPLKYN